VSPKSTLDSLLNELHCTLDFINKSDHDLGATEVELTGLPGAVLELEGRETCWHISLVLTSDDHLRQLHAEHHGDDTVTDVMSFLYGSDVGQSVTFGEIVLSVVGRSNRRRKPAGLWRKNSPFC